MGKEKEEVYEQNEKQGTDQKNEMETIFVDPEDVGPNSTVIIAGGDPNISPTAGKPLI